MQTLGCGPERAGTVGLSRLHEAGGSGWAVPLSLATLGLRPSQLSESNGRAGRTAESGHVFVLLGGRRGLVLGAGTLASGIIQNLPGCSWQIW